jgi:UDP-N-acetylmuramoyl-L-alanyl-D-glutamate--2,6-diaminopimelate ligase
VSDSVPVRPTRTEPRRLIDLLAVVDGLTTSADGLDKVYVSGVTHDSEQVRPGDLFAALTGRNQHGAVFAAAAAAQGAVAVLTDADGVATAKQSGLPIIVASDARRVLASVARWMYDDPTARLLVIGVTGTNGKTTSSYLIDAGLRAAGHRTGLIGTVETRITDTVLPSLHTTPEATDLQALFATMLERGVSAVAMEVSSHALALNRIDGTTFAAAVFTNLTQDHLDFHRDLEDYFAAKARLFTQEFTDVAVIDIDDAYGARLARDATTRVVTVSPAGDARADWWVDQIDTTTTGSTFALHGPGGVTSSAQTQLPGAFNVANAALSVVALVEAGIPLPHAVAGVAGCSHVPGRMQRVDAGQQFTAVVDYAHTPDAVTNVLASMRRATNSRLIVVLGCGGDRDQSKRPLMGAAAAAGSDVAVLTSDNPRSEDPMSILGAMEAGVAEVPPAERARVIVEPDRRAAIRLAVGLAEPGDVVVIAGKGHERTQEINGTKWPFDDAEELASAIGAAVRAS